MRSLLDHENCHPSPAYLIESVEQVIDDGGRQAQRRLIERILAHQSEGRHSTDTVAHTLTVASDTYASEHRLAAERQLFTHQPMVAGLSDLLPGPGTHAAIDVGDLVLLVAADAGGAKARNVLIGLVVGMLYKAGVGLGKLWPASVDIPIPVIPKAQIGIQPMPALLGVGYVLARNWRLRAGLDVHALSTKAAQ